MKLHNGVRCWDFSHKCYVHDLDNNMDKYLKDNFGLRQKLFIMADHPYCIGYVPELDNYDYLETVLDSQYQYHIVIIICIVELEWFDI